MKKLSMDTLTLLAGIIIFTIIGIAIHSYIDVVGTIFIITVMVLMGIITQLFNDEDKTNDSKEES